MCVCGGGGGHARDEASMDEGEGGGEMREYSGDRDSRSECSNLEINKA